MKHNFGNFLYGHYLRDELSVFIQKKHNYCNIIYTKVMMLNTIIFKN